MRNLNIMSLLLSASLLLAAAHASAQQGAENSVNVVVVFDASGSMEDSFGNGTRLDAAKKALRGVVAKLPAETNIGIVAFGSVRDEWVYPFGKKDDARITGAIDGISAGGGTPLGEYLKKGADRLLEARKANFDYGTYKLVVLTDGQASDEDLLEKYTPDIVNRNITLNVVGIDMASDHTLKRYANTYLAAGSAKALEQAVQNVLTEVQPGSSDSEEAFAIVNGSFSEESAKAAIASLASPGNHPIGEEPPKPPQPASQGAADGTQAPSASADPNAAPQGGCGCSAVGQDTHQRTGTLIAFASALLVLTIAVRSRSNRRAQEARARGRRS